MEASELRIYNLVRNEGYGIVKVFGINDVEEEILPSFEVNGGQGDWWGIENFEPIPLTPEILEKAAFIEFSKTEHFTSYAIRIDDEYELLITLGQQYPFIAFAEWQKQDEFCQHLHQLQNLYFALTGTELEINI